MLMFGLAALLVAVIMLVIFGGQDKIAGLEPSVFAGIATSGVLLLAWSGWFASQLRHDLRNTVQAIAAWGAIFIAMIAFYTYRFEFQDAANRVLAEIAPGMAISSRAGEVVIARSNSGSFLLSGRINGKPAQMIFDTGASRVVLTAETASSLGLTFTESSYTASVSTANGRTTTAPVVLDSIGIGDVVERRVQAFVARPGALRENLLGMSFLERLSSYQVRDDKLFLRQR